MIYAHWLAVRCSTQHRRPLLSRTASTVRLYLYHTHYVLSFLSFGPSSVRGERPNNRSAGGVRMLMGRPVGLCFTTGRGASGWGMGQYQSDAHEDGLIFPAGIALPLSLVHSCSSRVFKLPLAVRQPFAGLSWWFAVFGLGLGRVRLAAGVGVSIQVPRHGLRSSCWRWLVRL